ncbi:MAG: branched-chain amino acid ABC transporter permease [Spirochaetia bacterium]|nr:branched-chain amino acid ABC transporter permease [Spirochaetia bacterium]
MINTFYLKKAFLLSLPVMGGYLVLGFAFGLLVVSSGIAWYFATIMSLFVFAGSGQFVLIGLLAQKAPYMSILITIFLVNSRHIFYGLSFIDFFRSMGKRGYYMIFSLTDETYAMLSLIGQKPYSEEEKREISFSLSLLHQIYWVTGSTLGALFISFVPIITTGVEFSMTSLFVVILVEQLVNSKEYRVAIISLLVAFTFHFIFVGTSFLLPSLFFMLLVIFYFYVVQERRSRGE